MSKLLQLRGGTTSQHSSFTGAVREVTVDTDKDTLVVHDGSTAGGFELAKIASPALTGNPTAATQSAGNNSTRLATTAYADAAAAAVVDSAPGTLNTLNELAAALGDDANYATTTTNAIAAKLPLAGGTMTGHITLGDNNQIRLGASNDLAIYHDGNNSVINEEGTGGLNINTNGTGVNIQKGTTEIMAVFRTDSSVDLYYNNSKKFETTAAGATVTGVLTATLQANAIDSDHYVDGSIDNAHIATGAISNSKIGANEIDSQHYVDGSIDNAHLAADCVTGTKIADDAIDSNHYAADSIDNEHLSESLGDLRKGVSEIGRDGNDYIGIGTTQISFFLDGAEDMRLENDGDLHVEGDVIAYSTTVSDERLKDNIEVVDGALDKVKQLKGVTFTRKQDGQASAGVIAQDVEKVLPQAVKEKALPLQTGNDGLFKTVQYDALHALLIESIKELSARVEELEAK